ncbi:MAG: hypothetical protein KAS12_04085 [Candidatus Aenigmarchaeota archaeon]|nr:hypothetical protein [Candidatus Aenigmarchaeota archaeon]
MVFPLIAGWMAADAINRHRTLIITVVIILIILIIYIIWRCSRTEEMYIPVVGTGGGMSRHQTRDKRDNMGNMMRILDEDSFPRTRETMAVVKEYEPRLTIDDDLDEKYASRAFF